MAERNEQLEAESDERHELEQTRDALVARRDAIAADSDAYAKERIRAIDAAIEGRDGRAPIQPRQAKPGNVSMYDHLQSLKAQYQQERRAGGRIDQELARTDDRIAELEAQLEALSDGD